MEEEILYSYVALEKEDGKWALCENHFKNVGEKRKEKRTLAGTLVGVGPDSTCVGLRIPSMWGKKWKLKLVPMGPVSTPDLHQR